jgi:hypothetical protein
MRLALKSLALLLVLLFGSIAAHAQYQEAHKIDTAAKDKPESQVLARVSEALGISADSLKAQKTETGLSVGQLYVALVIAKGSKTDVKALLPRLKEKSLREIALENKIDLKTVSNDADKLEAAIKKIPKGK